MAVFSLFDFISQSTGCHTSFDKDPPQIVCIDKMYQHRPIVKMNLHINLIKVKYKCIQCSNIEIFLLL